MYIVSGMDTKGYIDEEIELHGAFHKHGAMGTFPQPTKLSHSKPCWSMSSTD